MKGIIFNLLEDVVSSVHGPDVWDALLDRSGASGVYSSLGSYPDEELAGLVQAAAAMLDTPEADILRWFGQQAIPRLAQRFPMFFDNAPDLRNFILGLNTIIHAEVRKLYPGAQCPHFDFGLLECDTLEMVYRSPRRLCALAEGFVLGAAAQYDDPVTIAHDHCIHHGASCCVFRISSDRVTDDHAKADPVL